MSDIDTLAINNIRCLAADVVQTADSGHPGMPMGMAPVAHTLFSRVLNFDGKDPKWFNRDRWLLSNGHGCALQYIMLHLGGYDLPLDELKRFRQVGSKTPGHPECHVTPGVEVTTGPLGQGFANAVGMALAQEHLKTVLNTPEVSVIDNTIYAFCGDGCLMEGVTSEAASFAGHLGLGSLVVVYDDNKITIDGSTDVTFTENVQKRFESYDWHVVVVERGNEDVESLHKALESAKSTKDKPSLVIVKTTIGFGSKIQGTAKVHGAPLGWADIEAVKSKFGFDPKEKFVIDQKVQDFYKQVNDKNHKVKQEWDEKINTTYKNQYPEKYALLQKLTSGDVLPKDWSFLPSFKPGDDAVATRKLSQQVLQKLAAAIPELIGGSADLAASNLTWIEKSKAMDKGDFSGRNINFGIREHGMAAICNGLSAYAPGIIPFCATFLNFVGYMAGASRLSSVSEVPVLYVMTHDSIGLGEDGPTHQPIEIVPMVRATPNSFLFRPADGNETSGAYKYALLQRKSPSYLCLSRQNLPQLEGTSIDAVAKGGYALNDEQDPELILVATGSEVSLIVDAAKQLKGEVRVRVVSLVCWELFEKQSQDYKLSVLNGKDGKIVPVLSVEALSVSGWDKYSHVQIGMRTFGASGPAKDLFKKFGFTTENVVKRSKQVVEFYSKNQNALGNLVLKPNLYDDDENVVPK
ncbi:transketolase [Acrasis kona]|uniref:Transketolase n=1 Tax=Acrasis kona TaxID=1008807 RepID=A0AAW2Z1Y4_9EUKA